MMTEADPHAEHVWRFDSDAHGQTALEFWHSVPEQIQTIELFVDLLLVQGEKSRDPIVELRAGVETLNDLRVDSEILQIFIRDSYDQLIDLGRKPQWAELRETHLFDKQPLRYRDEVFGLGDSVAERFSIQQRLGAGSFGVVFRAEEVGSGEDVALKIPRHSPRANRNRIYEMLSSEAIVAELIQTSSTARPAELVLDQGMPILVMPYIDGPTLRQLISDGPLPPHEAIRIMIQVFSVLDRAHQKKVLHRDVKPENILLNSSGEVFLTDFGLVLFEDDDQISREGEIAGTRGYLPPDALLGDAHVLDGRVDVWAGGMVLYECLTGRRFDAGVSRESALVSAIVSSKMVPDFSGDLDIPVDLQAICQRCLEPNPLHRYASTRDVIDALTQIQRPTPQSRTHLLSLSAWRFGLLFGRYSRSRRYLDAFDVQADSETTGLILMQAFGLQETLNDLRRTLIAFREDQTCSPEHSVVTTTMPIYPKYAATEIRMSLYDGTRSDIGRLLPEYVQQMDEWLHVTFDDVQSTFGRAAVPVLALFEFGYLAEQSIGAFGVRANLDSVAERTELPRDIWSDFCEQIERPDEFEQKQLEHLCQQLTKQVERYLLFER